MEGSATLKMLLRARPAPVPARTTAAAMNPYAGCLAAAARPKDTAMNSGTPITPSAMFWPEK